MNLRGLPDVGDRAVTVEQTDPFASELRDFVDAIANKRPPLSGLDDGVRNVALMDRAWEATSLRAV